LGLNAFGYAPVCRANVGLCHEHGASGPLGLGGGSDAAAELDAFGVT
jgi:hypothetical protein